MKKTVGVETFEETRSRKLERARKLDHGEKIPAERRVTFEDPELLLQQVVGLQYRVVLQQKALEEASSLLYNAASLARMEGWPENGKLFQAWVDRYKELLHGSEDSTPANVAQS